MNYLFHGLFSGPEIWSPYLETEDSVAVSLYAQDPLSLKLSPEDVLVGYSLGGRIALELAHRHEFQIKKLILLAAHPGIRDEEREVRRRWEDETLQRMRHSSKQEFLNFWNSLEIFSQSQLLVLGHERFRRGQELFDRFRLSQQRNYIPDLIPHANKILYIYGKQDRKYLEIGESPKSSGITVCAVEGDHRVYLNQQELQPILQDALL